MSRRRSRIDWSYDNDLQQFTTSSGRVVTLREIAQLLQDQVNCRHDFAGPWSGWRMRGAVLIPPGGTYRGANITASNALGYRRWLASFEGRQAQLPLNTPQQTPRTASDSRIEPSTSPVTPHMQPRVSPEIPIPEPIYAARRRAEVIVLADRRRDHAKR